MTVENRLRAVLDTNVLLRVILSRKSQGVAAAIWSLFKAGSFVLVSSESLLKELKETLLVPELSAIHTWSEEQVDEFVESIRELAAITPGTGVVEFRKLAERDATDLAFLAAALEGNASCIVSQDHDLLDTKNFKDISIIDPLAFLRILRSL